MDLSARQEEVEVGWRLVSMRAAPYVWGVRSGAVEQAAGVEGVDVDLVAQFLGKSKEGKRCIWFICANAGDWIGMGDRWLRPLEISWQ